MTTASGGITGNVSSAGDTFTLTSSTNMTNVVISGVSTYVGPANLASAYYGGKSKGNCCPQYLTVSGSLAAGSVQVVTVAGGCYGSPLTYSNPVTIASNTQATPVVSYVTTLAPNQAIAFIPYLSGDAALAVSMTFQYAPSIPCQPKCC